MPDRLVVWPQQPQTKEDPGIGLLQEQVQSRSFAFFRAGGFLEESLDKRDNPTRQQDTDERPADDTDGGTQQEWKRETAGLANPKHEDPWSFRTAKPIGRLTG